MARRNGRAPRDAWTLLARATYPPGPVADDLAAVGGHVLANDRYTVTVRPLHPDLGLAGWVHLSIRRNDRAAVRDWRHLQRLKNEAVGADREAVELYPAEHRLVDESNQYHLWVMPAGQEAAFGFAERQVGSPDIAAMVGARQRPFDQAPADLDAHDITSMRTTVRIPEVEA